MSFLIDAEQYYLSVFFFLDLSDIKLLNCLDTKIVLSSIDI